MLYWKYFKEDYQWLKAHGATKEQIDFYYKTVALDGLRNDVRYDRHNLPLYGQNKSEDDDDKEQFGHFVYQRGSQRDKSAAEEEDETGWCAMKLCITPIYAEDNTDVYLESVSIVEQLGDKELIDAIASMTERRQQILELLVDEWPQKKIAAYLGISGAAVSKHVAAIEKTLEPYFVKTRWIRLI